MLSINSNPYGHTMRDELFSMEKQFELRLASIKRTLELVPDDYIPTMFVNAGCVAIKYAYGMNMHFGDSPDQMPSVKGALIDSLEDVLQIEAYRSV